MAISRQRLMALLDRSTDIVIATDRKGTIAYYNEGASRTLGYGIDEILGQFVGRLYPSIEEARRVMKAMTGPDHGGEGICETFPTKFLSKTGEEIPVGISGTLIFDDEGEPDGTIGFAKDLREILHKDHMATLGQVAVGLSHEINNPLAVILNQSELLERDLFALAGDRDCSVELERVDAVRREVARISEIVGRLGEMARAEQYETIDYVGPTKMLDLRKRIDAPADAGLEGLRILVVDDDLGICGTMKEILEASGCKVDVAHDGVEALARIESGGVDLMLTDVVMPRMDGHELYLAVQEHFPDLPVLMMTAFHYDKDHIIKRSKMKGLEGVIFKKPVDPARLRKVIAETVGRSARE